MKENAVIYQVFVRNYSQEGTFKEVEKDIDEIKSLGVDILYLMPIHEIGVINRKGTFGSPYSIKDYFSISSDLGNKEDLISLINKTHEKGMEIILDMVFNHTSYDNVLVFSHPDYYYYRDGRRANRVGDWSDICDLACEKDEVQSYLLIVLKYWKDLGIDGFRFDVASMIPLSFFKKARTLLGESTIFIGESISNEFGDYLDSINVEHTEDKTMFPTFDSLYNYSWFRSFTNYLKGYSSLEEFINIFNNDIVSTSNRGRRINCLENHDNERIASFTTSEQLKSAIEFVSFIKGDLFIYAGQEYGDTHKAELFEKDPLNYEKNTTIYKWYKDAITYKRSQKEILEQHLVQVSENSFIAKVKYIDGTNEEKLFSF